MHLLRAQEFNQDITGLQICLYISTLPLTHGMALFTYELFIDGPCKIYKEGTFRRQQC